MCKTVKKPLKRLIIEVYLVSVIIRLVGLIIIIFSSFIF